MAMTTISPITEKFMDKFDPEDPEYQRDLIRPAEIKEDVKLMEQRKRVSIILNSKKFRKELEDVIRKQCHNLGLSDSSTSILSINHISEQLLLASIPRKSTSAIGVGVSTNGIIPINDLRDGLANVYSLNERQIRCNIAAVHRLMDMFSWCNGSTQYISARVSKDKDEFLIKPFGIFFHEVTASSLLTIDLKGETIHPGSTVLPPDTSNWSFHSTIHAARPDISCLIFLRTPAALCVSGSRSGFLQLSSDSIMLGEVNTFAPSLDSIDLNNPSEIYKLQADLLQVFDHDKKILLIPNRGIFIGGVSVEEAWFLVQRVQAACEVQEMLYKLDESELIFPDKEVVDDLQSVWRQFSEVTVTQGKPTNQQSPNNFQPKHRIGQLEFEAMIRHLDNSGYRTGYLYQTVNVYKSTSQEDGNKHRAKYPDVEIPPSCISLDSDAVMSHSVNTQRSLQQDSMRSTWFNTPNSYKLDSDFDLTVSLPNDQFHSTPSSPEHRKNHWVSINRQESAKVTPHHPVTPGAHISITRTAFNSVPVPTSKSTLTGIDPKELKAKQKKVKDRYYFDTNTAGPQSSLLDGLSWDEARRVREEGLTKFLGKLPSSRDEPLVTAASKGIIQREHKDNALVLENVFKPSNPFDKVTDDDLVKYKEEIDRKMHPELYSITEMVTSASEPDLICAKKVEAECSFLELPSIPQDTSITQDQLNTMDEPINDVVNNVPDTGITSDSDYGGESSMLRPAPVISLHGTMTSEASAAEFSHDDTEREGKHGKEKKKKKSFKALFSKKKKKEDKK